jgi:starch synthase
VASLPKVSLVTREYPPEIYGGAGVHVEYLSRELKSLVELKVHCFGKPRSAPEVAGNYEPWNALEGKAPELAALRTLSADLHIAAGVAGSQLVHTHTWYANMAGHLAKLMYGIPHVMTSHSLEPLRPWKAEQLGGGYALSCWAERTSIEAADAVVAVSSGMKRDILNCYPKVDPSRVHVIYNGIDPEEYQQSSSTEALQRVGIDPKRPYVMFVGRVTRQKGIVHLLRAAKHLVPEAQLVLCAGEPDTPEMGAEFRSLVAELRTQRTGVIWIEKMMPRPDVAELLGHATVFACPSVYEPFGIVNLEAMACSAPVVASAVGGIPEVVVDGQTGYLVHYENDGSPAGTPKDPEGFARHFAQRLNEVIGDAALAKRMGVAGRQRVVDVFSWHAIAEQTAELYRKLIG